MTREILSSSSPSDTAAPSSTPVPPMAAVAPADAPLEIDALAGALPDWDLLPASPFVRRMK